MARIVIKIGGIASQNLDEDSLELLSSWYQKGDELLIVHGGGFAITRLMDEAGVVTQKVDGLRITSREDMKLVQQALLEEVGQNLTNRLKLGGLSAYQLSEELAATVVADYINPDIYGEVGQVTKVETAVLEGIIERGEVPVLASLGYSTDGHLLNINADYLATAVAQAMAADQLILMTDVAGVLEDGQLLPELTCAQALAKIETGIISGGMVPKILSAIETVQAGVDSVVIGDNLLTGTVIKRGET